MHLLISSIFVYFTTKEINAVVGTWEERRREKEDIERSGADNKVKREWEWTAVKGTGRPQRVCAWEETHRASQW